MFSRTKVTLDEGLYRKAEARASRSGYESVDEFVTHILECTLTHTTDNDEDETVVQRLQGLGYL